MTSKISESRSLARLIGALYTEVFTRKPHQVNKPLNRSVHAIWEQGLSDALKTRDILSTNVSQWGPGGVSDETDGTPSSARWSFTGYWS